ncbi:MAG: AAA family ATPase [Pseudomonadota bacterium]
MLHTLAIANYRSVRRAHLRLEQLNLITGANGSGKSNLYRALRFLTEVARGRATLALAREGGLPSVLWAGPETVSRGIKQGRIPIQGGPRRNEVALRLGFASDTFGYAIDFGLPAPVPGTMFTQDPEIKRESLWHGDKWHPRRALVDRIGPVVRGRDEDGHWQVLKQHLPAYDSMLTEVADPVRAPEVLMARDTLRAWRFYDHFRCDADAPARAPHVGVRTPVLSNDGHDLAAAWRTVMEIGDAQGLADAVDDAFPGATVHVHAADGRFELLFEQPGLLRPLRQSEWSDGTLRYLLLVTALKTPRPPPLMVFNEPEMSLHPDLLPALGRLMCRYAEDHPLWVVSHARELTEALLADERTHDIRLEKTFSETCVVGQTPLSEAPWAWPARGK